MDRGAWCTTSHGGPQSTGHNFATEQEQQKRMAYLLLGEQADKGERITQSWFWLQKFSENIMQNCGWKYLFLSLCHIGFLSQVFIVQMHEQLY